MIGRFISWLLLLPAVLLPAAVPAASSTPAVGSSPQPPPPPAVSGEALQVRTVSTSSDVTVFTQTGQSSSTVVLNAPFGVRSEIVSDASGTHATTTPLSESDVKAMQDQEAQIRQRMDQEFADQERLFRDFWSGF